MLLLILMGLYLIYIINGFMIQHARSSLICAIIDSVPQRIRSKRNIPATTSKNGVNIYLSRENISIVSKWSPDPEIYIDWKGMPVGVPEEYRTLKESTSLALLIFLPHMQSHRNTKRINYIWYNQQCFINHCPKVVHHRYYAWS